jgi:hypothetical protein
MMMAMMMMMMMGFFFISRALVIVGKKVSMRMAQNFGSVLMSQLFPFHSAQVVQRSLGFFFISCGRVVG